MSKKGAESKKEEDKLKAVQQKTKEVADLTRQNIGSMHISYTHIHHSLPYHHYYHHQLISAVMGACSASLPSSMFAGPTIGP